MQFFNICLEMPHLQELPILTKRKIGGNKKISGQ